MARKLRFEYPGAVYQIINRGNYRAHLFRTEGAKAAFRSERGCFLSSDCGNIDS